MRNSNWMKHIRAFLFLVVVVCVYMVMNFAMEPTGYIRWVIHEVDNPKANVGVGSGATGTGVSSGVNSGANSSVAAGAMNSEAGKGGYDCLILGASLSRAAIDPTALDEIGYSENAFNYSIPGAAVEDSYYQLKEACTHNKVKKVIFGMDYTYWCSYPDKTFLSRLIYVRMPISMAKLEYVGRELLDKDFRTVYTTQWSYTYTKKAVMDNLNTKLTKEYFNHDINTVDLQEDNLVYKGKGYFMRDNNVEPSGAASASPWIDIGISKRTEKYFARMVDFCKKNNIELVCVTMPATPSVSVLGASENSAAYFKKICEENEVTYIDCNLVTLEELPRKDDEYNDWGGHMSDEMAQKFSKVLAKKLAGKDVKFYSDYRQLEAAIAG